jgi:uncharacterized caspase-like protein
MTASTRTLTGFVLWLAAAFLSSDAMGQKASQNPRIALVIGNATYRDAALATTANDAGLIAQTLQAAGFEVVGARDLDGQSLRTAFRDFLDKASAAGPDMQAFVYLAGRGVQYNGDNYFVPVDAQINRDADVPIDALRISDFAHALAQTPGKARFIVLDAARANPYAAQESSLAPGLALVDPEPGELIAFNAAPGTLAGDEQGPYGVFGKTLAGAMRQGGVDVVQVFDQVRIAVNQLTQGALLPWSASRLAEPYYIFERAADTPLPAGAAATANPPIASLPADAAYAASLQRDTIGGYEEYLAKYPDSAQAPRVRAILAALREAYFWRRSVNANTAHAYWTYLRRYPRGPHMADARRRLAMISAAYDPPADFRPMTYQDLPPPPPDEDFYETQPIYAFDAFGPPPPPPPPQYYYAEDEDWRDLPPPPPPVDVGILPVLAVGIPLVTGAVAFQHYDHYHRDGVAPAGLPPFRPPPPAPPPLPRNVNPIRPPAPAPVHVAGPEVGHVKPLPPIGALGGPSIKPTASVPETPVSGKAPASDRPPASRLIAPAPAKALPVPPPPVVTAPNTMQKSPPKPGSAPEPALNLPPKPGINRTSIAPVAPPTAPPPVVHAVAPPDVHVPSPPPVVHAPPSPPVVHAAPPTLVRAPPPPVVHAPPPQPPVVHAPPPTFVRAPPPPPPVVHAPPPPPVVHALPPPPPVVHAAPPPLVRAPPAAQQHAPPCGKPGLPPCPK